MQLENGRPIAGQGWAVVRWTIRQVLSTGVEATMPGATLAASGVILADVWLGKRIVVVDRLGQEFLE